MTGASSGIGLRTAERLVDAGALVAVFSRSESKLRTIAGKHPDRMLAVAGDVTDPGAIDGLFTMVESRFGDCDLLINNAGTVNPKSLVDTTPQEWQHMFDVHVLGTYLATRRALMKMIKLRRGTIVNEGTCSWILAQASWRMIPSMISISLLCVIVGTSS